jgi:hypothetical protein
MTAISAEFIDSLPNLEVIMPISVWATMPSMPLMRPAVGSW